MPPLAHKQAHRNDQTTSFARDMQSLVGEQASLIFGQDVFAMIGTVEAVGSDYVQMHSKGRTFWVPFHSIMYVRLAEGEDY